MADIFLSYNENDRDTVRQLAGTLEAVGWSVWWDRRIPAGGTWRQLLERELASMRCMVVVWSAHSVKSEWVCEEATEGRQLGCLVPVRIERVKPPAGFREIQAADLVGWDGSATSLGMRALIADIQQRIGAPPKPTQVRRPIPPGRSDPAVSFGRRRAWVLAGGPVAALVAIALFSGPLRPDATPSADPDKSASTPDSTIAGPSSPPAPTPVNLPTASAAADTPPPTKPITDRSPNKTRCGDLNLKLGAGETLTSEAKSFLQEHCAR